MKASVKNEGIDKFLKEVFGFHRVDSIEKNTCVSCGKPATKFKDEYSKREFAISGLCDECQQEIFN